VVLLKQGPHLVLCSEVNSRTFVQASKFLIDETHREIMPCLAITKENWKKQCSNASLRVNKTGLPPCLRQLRPSHLLRPPDVSGIRPDREALTSEFRGTKDHGDWLRNQLVVGESESRVVFERLYPGSALEFD
jgi:hypothetical protein